MQVIPVLDLLDGHVVRAVRGERSAYRPIQSRLAPTSDPLAVARALIEASGAPTLYIADLGAILRHGAHAATLAALRAALPRVELWLDAGFADYASMRALFERIDDALAQRNSQHDCDAAGSQLATLVPVFGTESLRDIHALHAARRDGYTPILSLDHRAGELLAATAHDGSSAWWPSRVIAMTLDQVGSYTGPDLATFQRLRAQAPAHTTLIGAGGIRNRDDLAAAARTGATAWLVASALHDRRIDCAPSDSA
ncbi:phosphoribosylformimino-5-aminoimidazole carboxamide ribotide isomerase [Paraburkholderia sp. MMS20-SJTN17]|uniref:Phosphoribosylformimino-5-aminoimidazole carboxamide ribotide isomerase n=1 Tax=Paraburkholderia translucens TaxID=2886945 RepID=A0ABS8KEF5_9BURK|nr:HisA/HisF-related TIM barrel protein [Paraburkholderia sp. MMS20-SJTN17]MCC8403176.1 phosphoribosylformimino-5-aminoimidazole carboxamide ribotide isomerase [Paraburkholderia sp. MMS20-SJTN17]